MHFGGVVWIMCIHISRSNTLSSRKTKETMEKYKKKHVFYETIR